jgi:hypothetical protein
VTGYVVLTQLGDKWIAVPFPTHDEAMHWLRDHPSFTAHGVVPLVTRHELGAMGAAL